MRAAKVKWNWKRISMVAAAVVLVAFALFGLLRRSKDEVSIEARLRNSQVIKVYDGGQMVEQPFEEYLVNVVAGEMPASYELEALKAQAVAARTYTAKKMEEGGCGRDGADICTDSTHCQAYRKDIPQESRDKLYQAVRETEGQVMRYEGKLIVALYHSTSGGYTEDNVNVFGQNLPYLKSVISEGEQDYPQYTRQKELDKGEAKRLTQEKYGEGDGDSVSIVSRLSSGRVEKAEVFGHTLTGKEVRELFSLASANFTVEEADGKLIFTNIGFGHGVGMSQVGADAMAKRGTGYQDILRHYYVGVTIEKL